MPEPPAKLSVIPEVPLGILELFELATVNVACGCMIETTLTTLVAAVVQTSPVCEAVIEQLPPVLTVTLFPPVMEHAGDEVEKVTG